MAKADIAQVNAAAREFRMTREERIGFGVYLEECKAAGVRGSKNARGDFTWDELLEKAREYLGRDR